MNLSEAMEPPLSPPPLDAPLDGLLRAPAPAAEAPALSGPPPLTTRLLRMGLVTLPQLSGAMAQQAATGRPLEELLVEMGLVSADDLAKLEEPTAPAAAVAAPVPPPPDAAVPAAAPGAAPALPPETPALVEVPAPAPALAPVAVAQHFAVVAELENGAKLDLGVYADLQHARDAATYAMQAIRDAGSDWPILGGRYVRPQSVLAIEVTALL
ncbi:MAG TPA: hypothetical protein VGJ77_01825 [Gaiellaceae bacterium]|jgi:hypothetical protein